MKPIKIYFVEVRMGKFGLTNILRNTTIKNNKRIVEVTERTGEIQINENELNTRLTTFEMIKRFFPIK